MNEIRAKRYLENGSLVAPFETRSRTCRAYFLLEASKKLRGAEYLVDWLLKRDECFLTAEHLVV